MAARAAERDPRVRLPRRARPGARRHARPELQHRRVRGDGRRRRRSGERDRGPANGVTEDGSTWSIDDRCYSITDPRRGGAVRDHVRHRGSLRRLHGRARAVRHERVDGRRHPLHVKAVQRDGRWFVSPVGTVLDIVDSVVQPNDAGSDLRDARALRRAFGRGARDARPADLGNGIRADEHARLHPRRPRRSAHRR